MGSGLVYEWGVWSIDGEWNMYGEGEGEGEGGFVDGFEVELWSVEWFEDMESGLEIWRYVPRIMYAPRDFELLGLGRGDWESWKDGWMGVSGCGKGKGREGKGNLTLFFYSILCDG